MVISDETSNFKSSQASSTNCEETDAKEKVTVAEAVVAAYVS